jgi:hypothetical protein
MVLPTGTISMSQVNTELGRSATATISLNESAVRSLAGVPSGAISMNDLRGKSAVTFTPDGGATAGTAVYLSSDVAFETATVSIFCSQEAVWNWTRSGSGTPAATASIVNGGSGTNIMFVLDRFDYGISQYTFNVSATAGGVTRYWTVMLKVENV